MNAELPPVLVLYNEPRRENDGHYCESEAGVLDEVKAVTAALERLGVSHRTASARYLSEVLPVVASSSEPVVFNLIEGFWDGPADAALVPTLLRAMGKGFTGNDAAAQILALDKWKAKSLLRCTSIPTPAAVRVGVGESVPNDELPASPFIVKPADTDASEGIHPSSVIDAPGSRLREKVEEIHRQLGQAVLIEEFIDGRELNVSLFDIDGRVEVLPIAEIDFRAFGQDRPRIVDYAAKWEKGSFAYENTPRVLPAPLPEALAEEVRALCRRTWKIMGLSGYARIDFRLDSRDRPYVLEVNPNPDISPDAGFAAALDCAGIEYHEFVRSAVASAAGQADGARRRTQPRPSTAGGVPHSVVIRHSEPSHRDAILDLVARTGFFRPDEVEIAREVLDEALAKGPQGPYQSLCGLGDDGAVLGWVCFGLTPCCIGTYDIYWLAVEPSAQGRGIGKQLIWDAEQRMAQRGGRLSIIETSGRSLYESTQRFYQACGYEEKARILDFYVAGDDQIVYVKNLESRA